jgi:ferredoxin-type protein NapH
MDFFQKNATFIIATILLTILLLIPASIVSPCPKGLINDPYPGRCGLYADKTQDQICDLSQTTTIAPVSKFNFSFAWQTGVFLTLFGVALVLLFKAKPIYRYLLLAISLALAIITFKNLCPIAFLQFLLILKDQATLNLFPFLIFLSVTISSLILGKVFCGWICPIGAAQELAYRLPRWLKLKVPDLTKKVPPSLKYSPFLVLGLIGLWVIRSGQVKFCQLDPFASLFGGSASLILLGALIILLIVGLFFFRPFCLFLCPLNALLMALSEISIFRIKKKKKVCNQCQICHQKCPTGAIDKKLKIDQKTCIRCQECLMSCPKKALSYQS